MFPTKTVCNLQSHSFGKLDRREVFANFDGGDITSDGGVVLISKIDQQFRISERLALVPESDIPKPKASTRKTKAPIESAPAMGKRNPRPLLPAYEGLTRVEAIAQLLQATPGQGVTTAQISEGLFGKLSAADHKAERKSLNTQLYKGQSQKLWQKGNAPGTFTIGAPTPSAKVQPTPKAPATKAKAPAKPPATTAAKRKSLTLLPAYAELTKREAIALAPAAKAKAVKPKPAAAKAKAPVKAKDE
jgi:hypothetical protein